MQTDVVSTLLKAVRLTGAVFFDVSTSAPWVAEAPAGCELIPSIMPGAQNLMEYHVVTAGDCWATLADAPQQSVRLRAGSVIVFPHGDAHVLSSAGHARPARLRYLPAARTWRIVAIPYRYRRKRSGENAFDLWLFWLRYAAV